MAVALAIIDEYARDPVREGEGEEYEIWILENGKWGLKAWSRAFDVGWALARVHSVPVGIVRTVYNGAFVAERSVIAELNSSQSVTFDPCPTQT